MSDKAQATVRIKWVRSGIGIDHHQKRIVRSLGLKKLNQEVERPDTPQIRGLVARVPHLVEIVGAPSRPAWTRVPEYVIYPPPAEPAKPAESGVEAPAGQADEVETPHSPAAAATAENAGNSASAPAEPPVGSGVEGEAAGEELSARKDKSPV